MSLGARLAVTAFGLAALLAAGLPTTAAGTAAGGQRAEEARRRQTIAVLPFDNLAVTGRERLDFLREWLADVATGQLTASGEITVVERRAIANVLAELRLGSSDLASAETRLRLGRMLGAQLFVFGHFTAIGERLQAVARIVDVESGVVLRGVEASGSPADPRAVAERLGAELGHGLGLSIARGAVDRRLDAPPDLRAAEAFYAALDLERRGLDDEAIDRYREALELAPGDAEAKRRLRRLLEGAP